MIKYDTKEVTDEGGKGTQRKEEVDAKKGKQKRKLKSVRVEKEYKGRKKNMKKRK